jgi:hypothetical protein
MWVAYYLRRWTHLLVASARLLWLGFGTDLARILQGAWLMLRAVQLWAPSPDNDPAAAQARMRELYGLVRLSCGQPADPARAARRIPSKQKAPGHAGSSAIPLMIPGLRSHPPAQRTERPPGAIRSA